jgi:hypothetical protein
MIHGNRFLINFVLVLFIFMLGACSSTPETTRTIMSEYDPPKWVMKGGGSFKDSNGKAFYGVGAASGIKNFSLQRTVADDRARNDLSKVFDFYTKSLAKDYMASTTNGDFSKTSEEQKIEVAIKTVTSATLTGVSIIDHWEHPGRNEIFSLARLDLESFKNNLDKLKELSQTVRKEIKDRADNLHEELEREVLKKEDKS